MLEKENDATNNLSNFNCGFSQRRLVLRITGHSKFYSIPLIEKWTIEKLINFIEISFKQESKNSKISLIYLGQVIQNHNITLESLFSNTSKKEVCQLFVIFKKQTTQKQEEPKEGFNFTSLASKPKSQILESKEFELVENLSFLNYRNNISYTLQNSNPSFNQMINCLPLFHQQVKNRYSQIMEKNQDTFENQIIEHFPLKNYFQFGLMLKLIFLFFLFGFGMKGFNLPIFVALLVCYYW